MQQTPLWADGVYGNVTVMHQILTRACLFLAVTGHSACETPPSRASPESSSMVDAPIAADASAPPHVDARALTFASEYSLWWMCLRGCASPLLAANRLVLASGNATLLHGSDALITAPWSQDGACGAILFVEREPLVLCLEAGAAAGGNLLERDGSVWHVRAEVAP